jgi:tetratricopeptide (TPR) repeat protein
LDEQLEGNGSVVVAQAVFGLGGVGKSELALQHAHAHRDEYQVAWWISAASLAQVQSGLATLAARLCPPIALIANTDDAAGWALGWLQTHSHWLLVLDNVEDPSDVESVMAQSLGGHIVITTRRDMDWGRVAVPIHLDVLAPEPAEEFLTARTGHANIQDKRDAALVAAELGYLPLALDQATAYMIQARIRPGQYLARLRAHPAQMYASIESGWSQQTVARLWDITIEAIRGRDSDAVKLLGVLACFAPESIPRSIIGRPGKDQVDDHLALLASYSIITLTATTVSMHRLVQAVIRGMDEGQARDLSPADVALGWLDAVLPADPVNDSSSWPLLRAMTQHVESLRHHYAEGEQPFLLCIIQNHIGRALSGHGDYQAALAFDKSALRMAQERLPPENPTLGVLLRAVVGTYLRLGQPTEALPLAQNALQIAETALENGDAEVIEVADALYTLGHTYCEAGRHTDELQLYERALQISETALEPDDERMGDALGHLAGIYRELGRFRDALPMQQRALRIYESALGPDHPSLASALGNLAGTYRDLGAPNYSLPLFKRALRITKATLGPDHPDMAARLLNLAATHRDLGQFTDALEPSEQALRIAETRLGADHPDLGAPLVGLANTYRDLGQVENALPLLLKAVRITEAALGPDHLRVGSWLGALAAVYVDLGREEDALLVLERAERITEAALGPYHPEIRRLLQERARAYRSLGRWDDARPLDRRIIEIRNRELYGTP